MNSAPSGPPAGTIRAPRACVHGRAQEQRGQEVARRLREGPGWPGPSRGAGQQAALGAEWSVCRAEPEGVPVAEGPCPANDLVLCLLHSCLGQELSDREIPLSAADQAAFLREVLRRTCHSPGEAPFPVPASSPAAFPHSQGGFRLGFWPPLLSTSEPCLSCRPSCLPPPLPHCRCRGATSGGRRDPEGSGEQQGPGAWRSSSSCPGRRWCLLPLRPLSP